MKQNTDKLFCCDVQKDINKLKEFTQFIENLSDKCYAHMDRPDSIRNLSLIKFSEAHQAFNVLLNIFNKYISLLGMQKFEPDDKIFFNGWKSIFK
jgi:hypothetical protein